MRRLLCVLMVAAVTASVVLLCPAPAGAEDVDRLDARGDAVDHGSPPVFPGDRPIAIAAGPGTGYWTATAAGDVRGFGGAPVFDPLGSTRVPIVTMAAHPGRGGYWLAAADGGVFAFGEARFLGSLGDRALARPIVGMASSPTGGGYWLVASDGGVFAFGDARFHGSLGGRPLNAPIVGMAESPGGGYWLVASDGGIFTFGGATFHGSAGDLRLLRPVRAMAALPDGTGYWLAATDGGVFAYGGARFHGAGTASGESVTAMAASGPGGYWLLRAPRRPDAAGPALPANSGSGRRVVYSNPQQRVWLVGDDGAVERTYPVSGKRGVPPGGTYSVFSRSRTTSAGHDGITMAYMVRFARGADLPIGFHDIPRDANGRPLQHEDDLGGYRSAGCVRQGSADAIFLWDWAPIGTTVVVVY